MTLPGIPSDQLNSVLAAGRGEVGTLFVSMARKHPDGRDAEYLRWHTLDHRPEQHRLPGVRASVRLVSTPQCRAARLAAASGPDARFDDIDHVMTYFFTDRTGLRAFNDLSTALGDGGRKLPLLPPVQRGVYTVMTKTAAPRVKVGSDVLPWWPFRGVVLLLETAGDAPTGLTDVDGVAGVWSATSHRVDASLASAGEGQVLTYCFTDDDPARVAGRLAPLLARRWAAGDAQPLLAAPFHPVVPHEWDRYVP
ncbi:hypothetical protein E4P42_07845 [Mycobacterium sp. PS03-16]|uniref:hypothetical protein n=1 Tax=Mycobacterium sp. PS03-16 TaxID=2559611 RepID=UPI00107344BB|nr:hypothetical protein [Mycobacterium sp. PS03-16]TFV59787.1 hypothetical protein E4P42_07845 [Mycobacterium sp. PS03-16]